MHQLHKNLQQIKNNLEIGGASRNYILVSLKEELQNYLLAGIYNNDKINSLIFTGGTCLRKLHGLNRLSEDLDFDNPNNLTPIQIATELDTYLKSLKIDNCDYSIQESNNVSRITFKFAVLYSLGLANAQDEKLHVKVEMTNPRGILESTLTPFAHDNLTAVIKHYNLETMMAGKISACLNRSFKKGDSGVIIKGRDYYDLIWYMQKKIYPSIEKLRAENTSDSIEEVFKILDKKVISITPEDLFIDLRSFFQSEKFIKQWCENFHSFYNNFRTKYD